MPERRRRKEVERKITAGGVKGKTKQGVLFRPVQGREELVARIVNSPNLYLFSMYNTEYGHSVAFDTRKDFWFFDANSGLWWCAKAKVDFEKMADWVFAYWDKIGYKNAYQLGNRELTTFA